MMRRASKRSVEAAVEFQSCGLVPTQPPTHLGVGRTLVQSNLCYDNGGSGIHTVKANRVDIIGNTAYLNSASKSLEYSQIYAYSSDDVRIINNVFYAPRGKPLDLSTEKSSANIVYANNLFFGAGDNNVQSGGGLGAGGGSKAGDLGSNVQADPRFVSASLDPAVADFRLAPDSPGIDRGATVPGMPHNDLLGHERPQGGAPDLGAYEMPSQG